jgi:hypothetical protein
MTAEDQQRLPNFFIVGAPKCATTSMDRYLAQHPDVFMASWKEPHYFAGDLYPPGETFGWEAYRNLFAEAGDERIVGESSVFYLLSRKAAHEIRAFRPDAKILVMLRNPIDLLSSHHSQLVYEGFEEIQDFATALAREPIRKAEDGPSPVYYRRVRHYRDVAALGTQLAQILEVFPREQVHVVIHDDLIQDTLCEYRKVLSFLGVDPEFAPDLSVRNPNKAPRNAALRDFLRNTPDWVTATSRVLLPSRQLRIEVKRALKRANTRVQPRAEVPEQVREQLAQELRPEVERLSALLDRDLTHWCWTDARATA